MQKAYLVPHNFDTTVTRLKKKLFVTEYKHFLEAYDTVSVHRTVTLHEALKWSTKLMKDLHVCTVHQ